MGLLKQLQFADLRAQGDLQLSAIHLSTSRSTPSEPPRMNRLTQTSAVEPSILELATCVFEIAATFLPMERSLSTIPRAKVDLPVAAIPIDE